MLNRRAVSGVQCVMRMPYSLDQLHTDEFNSPTTVHPIKLVKPEEPDVVTTFFGLYTLQEQSGANTVAVVHCRLNSPRSGCHICRASRICTTVSDSLEVLSTGPTGILMRRGGVQSQMFDQRIRYRRLTGFV